jgi:hypothetical protein
MTGWWLRLLNKFVAGAHGGFHNIHYATLSRRWRYAFSLAVSKVKGLLGRS